MNGRLSFRQLCAGAILIASGCTNATNNESDADTGINSASAGETDGTDTASDSMPAMTAGTMATGAEGTGSDTDDATGSMTMGETGDDSVSDSDPGSTSEGQGDLLFLEVTPPDLVIEVDLNSPTTQDYIVTAHYENGDQIDVTDQATWDVANPMVGGMNGATLEIPGFMNNFFGSSILTATVDGDEGQAQVTIAAYLQSGDTPDFFFVLPYEDPAGPQQKDLTFSTDVKQLDVFFNVDTTGSMGQEIANLQTALTTVVIPGIEAQVMDAEYGVGSMDDFPIAGYGNSSCPNDGGNPDQPFTLLTEVTDDVLSVQTAVNTLAVAGVPIGCGVDGPESHIEAMYQIATGEGLAGPAPTFVAANNTGVGGVGFREESMPIVVNITDALSHDPSSNACSQEQYTDAGVVAVAHDQTETMSALNDICARVLQVATVPGTATCGAQADGIQWNNATGAVVPPEAWNVAGHPAGCAVGECCTGLNGAGVPPDGSGLCPLTYAAQSNGTGVDASIVAGIEMVAAYSLFDVTREWSGVATDIDGVALPMGTTTADFIKSVVPASHGVVPVPGVADPVLTPTTFEGVVPDTDVTFTVEAFNDFVPQTDQPRLFVATIRILADDCGELDEREVFILVPPEDLPDPS